MMTAFWKKQNYCQVSIRERNDVKVTVSAQHSLSDYLDPMRCFTLLSPSFHSSLPFSKLFTFQKPSTITEDGRVVSPEAISFRKGVKFMA